MNQNGNANLANDQEDNNGGNLANNNAMNNGNLGNNNNNAMNGNLANNNNAMNTKLSDNCWASAALPALALLLLLGIWRYMRTVYITNFAMRKTVKFGLPIAVVVALVALVAQAVLCMQGKTGAAWAVGGGALGFVAIPGLPVIVMITLTLIFVLWVFLQSKMGK